MSIGNELRWILVIGGTILLAAIYWWGRRNDRRDRDPLPHRGELPSFSEEPLQESAEGPSDAANDLSNDLGNDDRFGETITIDEVSWRASAASDGELPEVRVHDEPASSRGRREPVLSDGFEEQPAEAAPPAAGAAGPAVAEPRAAPAAANAPQRKIFALRLSVANNGLRGEQLLGLLQGAHMEHGKFGIFHRMESNASVFSVASMVEPGSFDLASMEQSQYPGVTLFMLLPGPVDALVAFDQMLNFGRRLEQASGGVLQDERGRPLTLHALQKIRDELLDLQHLHGG